jgi:hypothetical protein
MNANWLLRAALLCSCAAGRLAAQDPSWVVFAFVQSGPAGCPASGAPQEPAFDPAFFGGCWVAPSQCPPLERAADGGTPLTLPFAGLPAGAPCLLVASPYGSPAVLPPCFQAGQDALGLVLANASGRASFVVRTPVVRLQLVGVVPLAWAQVYALDPSWSVAPPVLATSRVLRVEARF